MALADGYGPAGSTGGWIDDPNSFLASEIGASRIFLESQNVVIPTASASFPINEGLTTSKLSNWGVSSHTAFDKSLLPTGTWASINDEGFEGNNRSVTIVTASEASGGTTPVTVPLPSTLALLGLGLFGLFATLRRVAV